MKSELSQSPLSSAYLRQYPKRFERIIGLSVENVDKFNELSLNFVCYEKASQKKQVDCALSRYCGFGGIF